MSGFGLKYNEDIEFIFSQPIFLKFKKLINNLELNKNEEIFKLSSQYTQNFIELLKNNGIDSKETLYEIYPSVTKLIIKFMTSFYQFLINKKIINNESELQNNESENELDFSGPISGPLSGEKNFDPRDILFSRLIYLCILLFNHLKYDFKLDKDLSSEILLMTFKNINNEIRSLSPIKNIDF